MTFDHPPGGRVHGRHHDSGDRPSNHIMTPEAGLQSHHNSGGRPSSHIVIPEAGHSMILPSQRSDIQAHYPPAG